MQINNSNSTKALLNRKGRDCEVSLAEKGGTPHFFAQVCNCPTRPSVAYDFFDATRISQEQGLLDGISKIFSVDDAAYAGSVMEPKTTFAFNDSKMFRNVITTTISKDGDVMAMQIDQSNFGFTVEDIGHWVPLLVSNGLPIPKAASHSVYLCASAQASDEKMQAALQETVASILNGKKAFAQHPMITITSEHLDISWSEVAAASLPLPLDVISILLCCAFVVGFWEFVFVCLAWH